MSTLITLTLWQEMILIGHDGELEQVLTSLKNLPAHSLIARPILATIIIIIISFISFKKIGKVLEQKWTEDSVIILRSHYVRYLIRRWSILNWLTGLRFSRLQ